MTRSLAPVQQTDQDFYCSTCNAQVNQAQTLLGGAHPNVLFLTINRSELKEQRFAVNAPAVLDLSLWGGNHEYTLVACMYHVATNHHTTSVRTATGGYVYYDSTPSSPSGLLAQNDSSCVVSVTKYSWLFVVTSI